MATESRLFHVRASGEYACFTRPEFKAERVSYEVMTPSAARGLLEAVLWKPAIRWRVHEIAMLKPVQWLSLLRNEVASKATPRGDMHNFCADTESQRSQRYSVVLKDVSYLLTCSFEMTERAGPMDSVRKFEEMAQRRLERGQHFHQPYLGLREFAAKVELVETANEPTAEPAVMRPLGFMFYDYDYSGATPLPVYFEARLERGRLKVPSFKAARAMTLGAHP